MPQLHPILRWTTPLVAGVLITLSLSPFFWWPLGIVGAFLMALIWRHQSARQAAFSGWLFGLGLFGSGTSWVYVSIHEFGNAPVALAAFLTLLFVMGLALFTALQGWLLARFLRRDGAWLLLSFPGVWVLLEWFRGWFLTGFPWLYLGYAHVESPLAGWAPITGNFGISFIVTLTAATLLALLTDRNRITWGAVVTVIALWVAGIALHQVAWSHRVGSDLSVAVVQGNIPQELKWEATERLNIVRTYQSLSHPYWGKDLIVWPETAVPFYLHQAAPLTEEMDAEGKASHSTWISGIPTAYPIPGSDQYHIYNSIVAFGNGSGVYHKQRLVPFGEYVPLESWLRGLIDFFNLPMSDFSVGPENQPLLQVGQYRTAPFICYEIVYGDFVARRSRNADFLLTISNDSWFGDSFGPHQHLQIAQMRALENARDLVRSTNNGISALVDAQGHITKISDQFKQEVMTGNITPRQGLTPYAQTGSIPILLLAGVLALLARQKRQPA